MKRSLLIFIAIAIIPLSSFSQVKEGVTIKDSAINVIVITAIDDPVVVSETVCNFSIGDTCQGGIIFYLDKLGCHGLISAPTDQSAGIQWYSGNYSITYASGSRLFDGDGNCYMIRYSQGDCSSCNASELCLDLSLGGYDDWYLPSKYELNLMYHNIGQGNALGLGNIGSFANYFYWSSTEDDYYRAWGLMFNDGTHYVYVKNITDRVRAIRAF